MFLSSSVFIRVHLWLIAASAGPEDAEKLTSNARIVLSAIVRAAGENHRLPRKDTPGARAPFRRSGDELTEYYVRAGAAAARRLPEKEAAEAFLLALGIALDDSSLLRSNLLTRRLWRKVEPDDARKQRLDVLGEPKLQGRHDLAQHFGVSAALTAISGAKAAESAGIMKEMLDSRGGSGFSFADLSADFAGIAFAQRLLDKPRQIADVEKSFRIDDFSLSPRGLPEGLTADAFTKKYGSIKDERYLRIQEDIRKRIHALPGYREPPAEKPVSPPRSPCLWFPNAVWERLPRNSVSRSPAMTIPAKQSFAKTVPKRCLGTREPMACVILLRTDKQYALPIALRNSEPVTRPGYPAKKKVSTPRTGPRSLYEGTTSS